MSTEEQKRARKLWVEALRSGEYQQAEYDLQNGEGHCCLGVLCEVADHNGVKVYRDGNMLFGATLNHQAHVMQWAGVSKGYGSLKYLGQRTSLTDLNDNGKSFSELADIIESEPEGLFL